MSQWTLPPWVGLVWKSLYLLGFCQLLLLALSESFKIRLIAIEEYGRVIHEFDPYFNYRATEYLWEHGWKRFATWFDYQVWYPLGRPVGTTIYPGMQVTSVLIKTLLLPQWSINDICCYVPAWFGVLATISTALLCYETVLGKQPFGSILDSVPLIKDIYTRVLIPLTNLVLRLVTKFTGSSWGLDLNARKPPAIECAVFTAGIMSMVPAHLMRSVGGGYDNESVATTAMAFTFYAWTRSLRGSKPNYIWSVITGVAYFYMVAAWGGYVFVLNVIGVHASVLVLLGRYSTKLHRAYTLFYIVGTILAIQIPVVGWTPLKSIEQLGPLAAFLGFQLIELCEILKRRRNLSKLETWKLRVAVFAAAAVVGAAVVYVLAPTGYFGPISSRVRGLFVKHTKTGNPLVDSVAEHQPASQSAYFQYLHNVCYIAPVGFALVALFRFNDSSSFLVVYGWTAYFFSHRMVRLILLTAPIASVLGGIALGHVWAWCFGSLTSEQPTLQDLLFQDANEAETKPKETKVVETVPPKKKEGKKSTTDKPADKPKTSVPAADKPKPSVPADKTKASVPVSKGDPIVVRLLRFGMSAYLLFVLKPYFEDFYETCHRMAKALSHPTIIQKAQRRDNGQEILIDDYREAYFWLRDHTPEDARIMAWWDYGYQITGISNRTTIADGNTWNHEHIALLGRALTSPEKEGHRIARHLADYVLIWAGGGGDDLAKSPHMARIANSVYRHMCPGDPTCRSFGFASAGQPSAKMAASLLYKLHSHNLVPGVEADKNRFRLAYASTHGKVRIFKILSVSKESRAWVADPANRNCDVEGGWFCRGQYPPALQKILKEKKDFKQLEDFNIKREDDSEYQRQYMENLNNPGKAREQAAKKDQQTKVKPVVKTLSQEEIDEINADWDDNEMTTLVWQKVTEKDVRGLRDLFVEMPELAHIRSKDGRGPMWWAHETGQPDIIKLLKRLKVSESRVDAKGITPVDLSNQKEL